MAFEVHLLGSVEALADGRSLSLGGSKQRSVVAMLALHANKTLSGEALIDGLWGDEPTCRPPPRTSSTTSGGCVKLLAGSRAEAEILTRGRGYELRLPARGVDALCFEGLVEEARPRDGPMAPPANGAAQQRARTLARRPAFGRRRYEPFALPEIRRLEELHLQAQRARRLTPTSPPV